MAVLYMLHLESSVDVEKPRREDNAVGVDRNQREALKRFAKWVPCQCERACGRQWNFVNEIGMSRGGEGRECGVLKLFERASWRNILANKEMGWLMETRKRWEAA
jgi:calcium-independent phospholipase A2-gamma